MRFRLLSMICAAAAAAPRSDARHGPGATGTIAPDAGMDHKQTVAAYHRSQAARSQSEGHGVERDANAENERATTLSPDDLKRANAERSRTKGTKLKQRPAGQPVGDEIPVTGLDDTPRGRQRADGDPAKEISMTESKRGGSAATKSAAKAPANEGPEQKQARLLAERKTKFQKAAKGATLEEIQAELPIGSTIEVTGSGVNIRSAIAGGGVRVFGGKDLVHAVAEMREELEHGPGSIDPNTQRSEPTKVVASGESGEVDDQGTTRQVGGVGAETPADPKAASRKAAAGRKAAGKAAGVKVSRKSSAKKSSARKSAKK